MDDEDAGYEQILQNNVGLLEPLIAMPHSVDRIVPLPPFIRAFIDSGGVVAHFMQRDNYYST